MNTQRPALIFDFGNVIAFFDYRRGIQALAGRAGTDPARFLERVSASGLPELAKRYENGAITSDAFSTAARALIGVELGHDEFVDLWTDIFWPNESVAVLIRELKDRGYPLVVGSNTNELHASRFRRQFAEVLSLFDGLVLSYEVGCGKPDAAFYHACARLAGAGPGECVFIDDMPVNVAGAEAAGLRGLLYSDTPRLIADLAALGVSVGGPTA